MCHCLHIPWRSRRHVHELAKIELGLVIGASEKSPITKACSDLLAERFAKAALDLASILYPCMDRAMLKQCCKRIKSLFRVLINLQLKCS